MMKKSKRAFVLFAAGVLVLTLTVCRSLRSALKEPALSLDSVSITGIDFNSVDLLCKINVDNPNAFDIPFPEIDWECFINANSFVAGTIKSGGYIKSRAGATVEAPVSMAYAGMFNNIASLANSNKADCTIKLGVTFTIPVLGGKTWNFEHTGSLPLPRVPSVGFKGISVKNLSLSRLEFEAGLEIENDNIFDLNINELVCNLSVNNTRWFSGSVPDAPVIKAEGKTTIPIVVSIDALSLVKDLTLIITTGRDAAVSLSGNLSAVGNFPGFKPLELPFSYNGNTKLPR
ncbi:MAG: LEA type 2 family protein [Treponema sp.]|jgi:LEA14-like dessication related protein|nr:LEA type 2 family protein [Treponema sp.]